MKHKNNTNKTYKKQLSQRLFFLFMTTGFSKWLGKYPRVVLRHTSEEGFIGKTIGYVGERLRFL